MIDTATHGPADLYRGVAWRYGPDEWASVSSQSNDFGRSAALAIARSVQLGPDPLRTPLRVRLTGATERDWGTNYPYRNDETAVGSFALLRDRGHVTQVALVDGRVTSTEMTTIDGRTAYWSAGHRVLDIVISPTQAVEVMAVTGGRAEALRVARATSVAAMPNRVSTWFDAADALP